MTKPDLLHEWSTEKRAALEARREELQDRQMQHAAALGLIEDEMADLEARVGLLDEIVAERIGGRKPIGFVAEKEKERRELTPAELLQRVASDDLLKYGLIPEFVGRLPMVVSVEPLDKEMLIRILTEPKNALVKQFQKLFDMDSVELTFTDEALDTAAEKAMEYKMGARGLRTIIEGVLLDVMYEIPSLKNVQRCVITGDTILGNSKPELTFWTEGKGLEEIA